MIPSRGSAQPLPGTPSRYCDLVMKGGITSGVVYPRAACALAAEYRFRNIGGTSAGAIAAAATAAAEYGRGVPGAGFERLDALPDRLGQDGHLFELFQPQPATHGLFALATAGMGQGSRAAKAARLCWAIARHFAGWVLLGAAPAVVLGWAAAGGVAGTGARAAVITLAAALALAGAAVALAAGVARRATLALPANAYGLCRGFDVDERDDRPGLARWLDGELDALAGRSPTDVPLTFGHLWGTVSDAARPDAARSATARQEPGTVPTPPAAPTGGDGVETESLPVDALPPGVTPPRDARRINLEMVTTSLTHGRPYRLPFAERVFYFDPTELRRYFPERVVRWMERTSPPEKATFGAHGRTLLALPLPADLPVVVAARLSLSFPVLISAVPLYAVDHGRPKRPPDQRLPAERCWFSDGGLSSNFPIHFFDALVPRWPTFGINLRPFTRDYPRQPDERDNIYMARTNGDGLSEWWTRFEEHEATGAPRGGLGKLAGFAAAILGATRDWRDNTQTRVPGYRDRVVHVKLDESREGGLNLKMPPDVIADLAARGRAAGERIVERYARPEPPPGSDVAVSWANHRWVRYRGAMGVLQAALRGVRDAMRAPVPGDPDYATLIARPPGTPPRSYPWTSTQRAADPLAMTEALLGVVDAWDRAGMDFAHRAPRPTPELRTLPRV